ncbi:unnamed protein product [Caenorhabditis angaria]|uniref:Uncharacterized protein n=1 Tax=Caenorhabditis angaria TaxID=860376 RepID=A0A9P1MXQ6_9PELO|nr:unnamed protein product [Caenorhabditis angaria]
MPEGASRKEKLAAVKSALNSPVFDGVNYLFTLTIPILLIAIGFWKKDGCPAEPMIPTWLIVAGFALIIERVSSTIVTKQRKSVDEKYPATENETDIEIEEREKLRKKNYPFLLTFVYLACRAFQIVWFFLGVYWVIKSFDSSEQCHWAPYYLTILFTLVSLCFGLFCACCGVCLCCGIMAIPGLVKLGDDNEKRNEEGVEASAV